MALTTVSAGKSSGITLAGNFNQPAATGAQVIRTVDLVAEIGGAARIDITLDCENVTHNNTRARVQLLVGGSWLTIDNLTTTVGSSSEIVTIPAFTAAVNFRVTLDSPVASAYVVPYSITASRLI